MTSQLFQPITIGKIHLKNRVGLAPMTRTSATNDGLATDQMVSYYKKFAAGGIGLIITEGTYPEQKYSQGYFNQPGLTDEE
jgi:2,4-dienoyl-CoA reductase-like NADH-dependent reductase (Old Yellow Enzyme family)